MRQAFGLTYIEHQLDGGGGDAVGGGRFPFGTALEPVGASPFRRLLTLPETVP